MPRGDKTGPFGEGPKTGRQMGYCTGYDSHGFANMQTKWRGIGRGSGRGFCRGPGGGFGRGIGPGSRHGYGRDCGAVPDVSEKTLIENEIRVLKDQLASLEDRLSKLGEG